MYLFSEKYVLYALVLIVTIFTAFLLLVFVKQTIKKFRYRGSILDLYLPYHFFLQKMLQIGSSLRKAMVPHLSMAQSRQQVPKQMLHLSPCRMVYEGKHVLLVHIS